MTTVLHIQARPDAPIACDMSTASDTPDERLVEYNRLFGQALRGRERRAQSVVFSFRADPGTRDTIEGLVRREAACCPFLEYRVEAVGDEVRWTTTNTLTAHARGDADVILDMFYALPDLAASDRAGYSARLGDRGLHIVD